ncbi:GNAT family N-acetyltransferase [Candidatus Bathyarchaeota archaeon]|nr:GNAT family N-acetyltransferase [Candidatus Bathyarchaeota archaeon]
MNFEKIGIHNFSKAPEPCRFCLYWQTKGELQNAASKRDVEKEKLKWLNIVEKTFGNCIEIVSLNGTTIGFMQYALAKYFPRVEDYFSGPPSEDAAFIACLYIVDKDQRRRGYGTVMLEKLLKELSGRGFKAVETFARMSSENNPSGPLTFYLKHGFEIVRQIDDFPLVRIKL